MRILLCRLFTLALLAASTAHAAWPDSGWYWNPAESGRGFAIEIQDDKLFVAVYTYEASGAPVYFYAAGPMSSDRSFSATLYRTSSGQCIGCSYRPPAISAAGSIQIMFDSYESATVTALGTTLAVRRFDFSETNLFHPSALFGEWAMTEGDASGGTFSGERITLSHMVSDASGNRFAAGHRSGAPERLSIALCDGRDICVMALNHSPGSDRYYMFSMAGFNRMEGLVQAVPTGALPTIGDGVYFVGHRTKSRALVQSGAGPGMMKGGEAPKSSPEAPGTASRERLLGDAAARLAALKRMAR